MKAYLCDYEQVSDEELEMEVKNAIDEFTHYNQEYDEARVKEQVGNVL